MFCKKLCFLTLLITIPTNLISSSDTKTHQQALHEVIAEKKNFLHADDSTQSFATFELQFSEEEHIIFENLQIKKPLTYNLYGSPEGKEQEISEYIQSLSNNEQTSLIAAQTIVRISKEILTGFNLPASWITLRASRPNHDFDIPRWHTDGHQYLRHKVVITLQGPGTLLSEVSTETREEYKKRDVQGREQIKAYNPHLTEQELSIKHSNENRELFTPLFPSEHIQQAATRQGVIFIVGDEQRAAFHSEPAITAFRLFMSIMPGSIEHIQNWRKKHQIISMKK